MANPFSLQARIPNEIWHKIIGYVGSIPYEFDPLPLLSVNTSSNRHQVYAAQWQTAIRERLCMSLVCKTWSAISYEFIFSSIVIDSHVRLSAFMHFAEKPNIAWHILRVTITEDPHIPKNEEPSCFEALERCVNLRVFASFPSCMSIWPRRNPKLLHFDFNGVYGLDESDKYDQLGPIFQAISHFPSLKVLRLTEITAGGPRAIHGGNFPKLEELQIDFSQYPAHGFKDPLMATWLPTCNLPRLRSLIVNASGQSTKALVTFGEQLTTVGLESTPRLESSQPSTRIRLPKMRTFVLKHRFFGSNWSGFLDTIDLTPVKRVEVQFYQAVDQYCNAWLPPDWGPEIYESSMRALLAVLSEPDATPSLHQITFDVGPYKPDYIWEDICREIYGWLIGFRSRRPTIQILTSYFDQRTAQCVSVSLDTYLNDKFKFENADEEGFDLEDEDAWMAYFERQAASPTPTSSKAGTSTHTSLSS